MRSVPSNGDLRAPGSSSDPEDYACQILPDQVVEVLPGGYLRFDDGKVVFHEDCYFHVGSVFVLHYGDDSPPPPQETDVSDIAHIPTEVVAPVPVPVEPISLPLHGEVAPVPGTAPLADIEPTQGGTWATQDIPSSDLVGVTDAAGRLDTEYAGLVAVVLAVLAVLGGRQAWRFYSSWAEQRHELALKKLDLASASAGAQPPPCQAVKLEVEKRLEGVEKRLDGALARLAGMDRSVDSLEEDQAAQAAALKRLKKAVKKLKPPAPGGDQ